MPFIIIIIMSLFQPIAVFNKLNYRKGQLIDIVAVMVQSSSVVSHFK